MEAPMKVTAFDLNFFAKKMQSKLHGTLPKQSNRVQGFFSAIA